MKKIMNNNKRKKKKIAKSGGIYKFKYTFLIAAVNPTSPIKTASNFRNDQMTFSTDFQWFAQFFKFGAATNFSLFNFFFLFLILFPTKSRCPTRSRDSNY